MTLIDGDRIITAQLYDDEHEEFTEKRMSIIEYINAYTDEGVTTADDVLDKIRAEIESIENYATDNGHDIWVRSPDEIKKDVLAILDKYKLESDKIGTGEFEADSSAYKGMTNGEVIKMLYPQGEIVAGLYGISENSLILVNLNVTTECSEMMFTEDWWNSPYKPQERGDKECGTPLLKVSIPYLMHKQMDIPISECQKAYEVAVDYLRSKANMKG